MRLASAAMRSVRDAMRSRPGVSMSLLAFAIPLFGCAPSAPTWSEDVAPILEEHCLSCHQTGQVGPMALDTYEAAVEWASVIVATTQARTMPPWGVTTDGSCGEFREPRWLDDADLETLREWAEGAQEPGARQVVPVPEAPGLDVVHKEIAPLDPHVPSGDPDEYRCFLIDPDLDEDTFLTAWEVRPGAPEEVHHMILYTLDSEAAEAQADQLDGLDPEPGYSCFGSSLVGESRPIAAWAPGTPPTVLPDGSGIRLLAGRRLVMQLHYYTPGEAVPDQTSIAMTLESSVQREALTYLLADLAMEIEPGRPDAPASFELSLGQLGLPLGVYVRGVFPHMHRRGQTLRLESTHEGQTQCLIDVPRWDFDWQQMVFYDQARYLFPTETLRLSCTFDTTDDTEPVAWGEGTEDEMCLVGLLVTLG